MTTLADFWGVERVAPELDDDMGTSLVVVHSSVGRLAFDSIVDLIDERRVPVETAIHSNPAAVRSAHLNPKTEDFYRDLDRMRFDWLIQKYCAPSLLARGRRILSRIGRGVRTTLRIENHYLTP